jgi:hypothetical protein
MFPKRSLNVFARWDVLLGLLVMYSVIVSPYRLGFEHYATTTMFWFELTIDIIFGIDIVLNFRTAFQVCVCRVCACVCVCVCVCCVLVCVPGSELGCVVVYTQGMFPNTVLPLEGDTGCFELFPKRMILHKHLHPYI